MLKATREGFGEALEECTNTNVLVLSADLSKATMGNRFGKKFPERFIECGIAESNMIGIASGLSANGYRVVISSFASFLTGRYDQIRCSLAYSKAPVIIVGTHAGMAIGKDGVTQMGLEDLNLMRGIPGMDVFNPATAIEARAITQCLLDSETELTNPVYLRLGRQPVKNDIVPSRVDRKSRTLIISTGCIATECLSISEKLKYDYASCLQIKPLSQELTDTLGQYKKIITVEDHSIIGGLGTAISEEVAARGIGAQVIRIGLEDKFPESGKPSDLYKKYGLDEEGIIAKINLYDK